MGKMFGDNFIQQIYHDNHREFEKKVHSQYAKYLEELPFFTDYFHIVKALSTEDTGLLNVEKLHGTNSPIRYNLLKNFPLFGLERILTDLEDDDNIGLQTEYSGEAIILPNTITPLPDDHFSITAIGKKHFFRVTEIHYDTILDRNYYKINFVIRAVDNTKYYKEFLEKTNDTYVCIYDNYGTQDSFIIKEEDYNKQEKLMNLYNKITKKYFLYFYNEKYNALVIKNDFGINCLYDAFVNYFCNEQELFSYNPRELMNYKFYLETRPEFHLLYLNSIFNVFINKDLEILRSNKFLKYFYTIPTFTDSIFQFYGDYDTSSVNYSSKKINLFNKHNHNIISEEFLDALQNNSHTEFTNNIYNILISYLYDQDVSKLLNITDIKISYSYEDYILIPILLFIIRKQFSSTNSEITTKEV